MQTLLLICINHKKRGHSTFGENKKRFFSFLFLRFSNSVLIACAARWQRRKKSPGRKMDLLPFLLDVQKQLKVNFRLTNRTEHFLPKQIIFERICLCFSTLFVSWMNKVKKAKNQQLMESASNYCVIVFNSFVSRSSAVFTTALTEARFCTGWHALSTPQTHTLYFTVAHTCAAAVNTH